MIPYGRGELKRLSVREHLRALGPPDVLFLGSSRFQAGLLMPRIRQALEEKKGRSLRVESYAMGGASNLENKEIMSWLRGRGMRASWVVVEAIPMDLYLDPNAQQELALGSFYWTLSDWWVAYQKDPASVGPLFGRVCRNHFADGLASFRYRDRLLNLMKNLGKGRDPQRSAVFGDLEETDHVISAKKTITTFDAKGLETHLREDHFSGQERPQWYPEREAKVTEMLRDLREGGSQVILVECPVTKFFEGGYPSGVREEIERRFAAMAKRAGVEFIKADSLREALQDEAHFQDANHANLAGAELISEWLIKEVLLPRLPKK